MNMYWANITSQFNNREIAVAFWLLLFFSWALTNDGVRRAVHQLFKAFLQYKIIVVISLMTFYILGIILLLKNLNLWSAAENLKETIIWATTVAFMLTLNFSEAQKESFFRKIIFSILSFTIVFEFLGGLYVYSLPIELIIVPLSVLLGMTLSLAEIKQEFAVLVKSLRWLLAVMGFIFLWHSLRNLIIDWNELDKAQQLIGLVLPSVLTLLFLPFIYFFALYATYESLFVRLKIWNSDPQLMSFTKHRILYSFGLNLHKLSEWSKQTPSLKVNSKEDAIILIKK